MSNINLLSQFRLKIIFTPAKNIRDDDSLYDNKSTDFEGDDDDSEDVYDER